jgi:hypothetical protein
MTNRGWVTTLALANLSIAAALAVIAVFFVRAPMFLMLFTDPFLQVQDYPFSLYKSGCKIVIFGDSTGMTGYDPSIIEAITGLRTCNISQTKSIVTINGTFPIDAYLAKNEKPDYIVIQVGPETYSRDPDWDHLSDTHPLTEMLRHRFGLVTLWELGIHPRQTSAYLLHSISATMFPNKALLRAYEPLYSQAISEFYRTRGLMKLPKEPEVSCSAVHSTAQLPPDKAWMQKVRKKYADQGINVLMNASPVPECEPMLPYFRKTLRPLLDNDIVTYPISEFNDMDRHFTPDGVVRASSALAAQIKTKLSYKAGRVDDRRISLSSTKVSNDGFPE